MSDKLPNPLDMPGDDADEELVFDEPEAVALPAAVEPEPKARKVRRGSRQADAPVAAAMVEAEPAIDEAGAAEPMPTPSEAASVAAAEDPAGSAPVTFPPREAGPAGSRMQPWLLAIVALALLTSVISLGGLITVSRTLARADAEREAAQAERETLARVPDLVARLDGASVRLDTAAQHLATSAPSGPPATVADIRHELDSLKLALAEHQPEGVGTLNSTTRDGFSVIATRLDRLTDEIDRSKSGGGGAVSASRPASHASYPAQPS